MHWKDLWDVIMFCSPGLYIVISYFYDKKIFFFFCTVIIQVERNFVCVSLKEALAEILAHLKGRINPNLKKSEYRGAFRKVRYDHIIIHPCV